MAKAHRVPELDGLRALAILPVLMLHFAPLSGPLRWLGPLSNIGWIGVDLFFVLSGYLITGILLDTAGRPHYYRNFIVRRALRILPLYYICLTFFCAATYLNHDRWRLLLQWGGPNWFVFFLGNFIVAARNTYPPLISLWPLWSLQVEEQFYLLFPFIVVSRSIASLRRILIACVIAAPIIRCLMFIINPGSYLAPYVLTVCRMDSLALGGLVAVAMRTGGLPLSSRMFGRLFIGLALVCTAMFVLVSSDGLHPLMRSIGYSVIDLACVSLLACIVISPDGYAARVLRWSPLVYTGQLAYGLYLLHEPAAWIARRMVVHLWPIEPHGTLDLCVSLAAAFAAAALSWKLFESKMISLKDRFADQSAKDTYNPSAAIVT
jgi:peptidoglycan/LPS O-acetylase OafA/YrhL